VLEVSSQNLGELLVFGGFDTCTAFGAMYGSGTAPLPTQPPNIEKLLLEQLKRSYSSTCAGTAYVLIAPVLVPVILLAILTFLLRI
jgi:hypothetical protein